MNKYIDAEPLRKEIEKRMHICDGIFERDSDTYYQGKAVAYQETLPLIDSLQQEQTSLPSNLDEAAKKIVIQLHPCMEYSSVLGDHLTMGELVELVKAGAEWQKGQMLKDAAMVEGEVVELGETYKSLAFTVGLEELNEVLQPLGVKDGDRVRMIVIKEEEK